MKDSLLRRAVKVTWRRRENVDLLESYSSGWAISPDLLLTAGHGVGPVGAACHIATSDTADAPSIAARVVWRGDALGLDAALVRASEPVLATDEPTTVFAELCGSAEVKCLTIGYPAARHDSRRRRRVDVVPGRIMPGNGVEDDKYIFDSTAIAPNPLPATRDENGEVLSRPSPMAGHSGAAVLTADSRHLLVGIAIEVPHRYPTGRIEAVRVAKLLTDPSFAQLVSSPGRVVQVHAVPLPTGVVEHDDAVHQSFMAAKNLRSEQLQYVPPPKDSRFHPDNLLERLAECAGDSGLVLIGAAGIGKTRTCVEVGDRAVNAGWRVLHVNPGDLPVTTEQLIQALDSTTTDRVLFVVDYLNESRLDFPSIKHTLLPEAQRRGIHVALLASARPGWYHTANSAAAKQVFRAVELLPEDEYLGQLRDEIIRRLAPTARGILGEEQLRYLCGNRPIMVVLVTSEAEAQAAEGLLHRSTEGIRPEKLTDWLEQRLREDELLHEATSALSVKAPGIELQTCAAMVAAMPQDSATVLASGAALLDGDAELAEGLLDRLIAMGWVGQSGGGIGTIHDIVTDQLLETTMIREATSTVWRSAADQILAGALTRARTFGRYALNLGRLLRDLDLTGRGDLLSQYLAGWLAAHTIESGGLLVQEQDEGSYAIGAIIDNAAWSPVVFEHWESVVGPWLTQHETSLPARHILYKGLRAVAPMHADPLIKDACNWLRQHGAVLEAGFVLAPLLGRQLEPSAASQAVDAALAWLRRHGTTFEAEFVLAPLLGRQLEPSAASQAVDAALAWLRRHGTTPDAGFVLESLLANHSVTHASADFLANVEEWLLRYSLLPAVEFVAKHLSREGILSRRSMYAIVLGALQSTVSIEIGWRLTSALVARDKEGLRTIDSDPRLANMVLLALDSQLSMLTSEPSKLNAHSELDGLFEQMCRARIYRSGIGAARLDDLLTTWLARPESLSPRPSADSYFSSLTSRICALVQSERLDSAAAFALLQRVREWVGVWKYDHGSRHVIESVALLDRVESLIRARSES